VKIRWKLLILLLAIALAPLIASAVIQGRLMRKVGERMSAEQGEILAQQARSTLQKVVDDYGAVIQRDKRLVELSVEIQALEAEKRLRSLPPAERTLLYASDFDEGLRIPADAAVSPVHAGEKGPMLVSYSDQAYLVPADVNEADVRDDMLRLSTMPEVYETLRRDISYAVKWQYTSLASGLHTTYPAHGGYPSDYDPRARQWYTEARNAGRLTWIVVTDVTTGLVALTAGKPICGPDGEFAGVTAIDVPLSGVLEGLSPPALWGNAPKAMFVAIGTAGTEYEGKLGILAQASDIVQHRDWRKPVEMEFLTSDDPHELAELVADAQAGRSGVRRMSYRGEDSLWGYSSVSQDGGGFPIVILPYATIVQLAVEAEQRVLGGIAKVLKLTGISLVVVLIVVAVVAARASETVTQPVRELTGAAEDLAGGNYDAHAEVRSHDEIGELAGIFNDMGPKLRDREKMKRSLALAMEVQQHLLPQETPTLAGFDIAGESIYCDETGGDYYDFIEMHSLGSGKLGIAVGDVTGHGIGAALLMASARAVLRSHAEQRGEDLSGLFDTLNHHLVRDTGASRFMTLFYGIVDSGDRSLRWISGGHDPAIRLRRSTNEFDELVSLGVPLGVQEGMAYESSGPLMLGAGDIVVIGTDGIWEARNRVGEMFGKDRLREVIAAHADRSARSIFESVAGAVKEFIGVGPQEDDVTLVVVKVAGDG